MGTISSNIGLITGFPIQDTVDKLVALQAAPRDALVAKNKSLADKQVAYTSMQALITALQIHSSKLTGNLLYSERIVASGNPSLLSVTTKGPVAAGTYQFTPIRQVQAQQLTSSRVASDTAALGGGTIALRFGGYVDPGVGLDMLNGGEGFDRGKIRITDRSGAVADIDLSTARSIDDVIAAINSASGIQVVAQASGDHLRLIDASGGSSVNLKVSEVDGGTTAASLGLSGINVAASSANGTGVLRAFSELNLNKLNQGTGVRFDDALNDLQVNFRDGTGATVDFQRLAIAGTRASGTTQGSLEPNSQLSFTAVTAGSAYAGVQVVFQNDDNIVAGSNEGVDYDDQTKTLTFRIRAGQSTADNVLDALDRNPNVSPLFTAANAGGSNGSGLVSTSDTATLDGLQASAITSSTNGVDAQVLFTAVNGGAAGDGVTVSFVNNVGVLPGQETVVYDDSNPLNKTLIFQIADGQTTADNIIAALANDPLASQVFTAARADGGSGQGIVTASDTAVTSGGALIEPVAGGNETTLADVLATLNSAAPGKLQATLSPDGSRLILTDLTADNGSQFSIVDLNGSHAAADLGLATTASGGTINGGKLLAGLKTSLLRNLDGGSGITALGTINLTDRSGASASVNLASAETLEDVINTVNNSGLGITASVNSARDGILLTDTTNQTGSNLIVANGDVTNTADRLGLTINAAASSVNSGDLKLAIVNENTTLASLNGGKGIALGTLKLNDTLGSSATVNVTAAQKTIGDLVNLLNATGLAIHARINDRGDGIAIEDTAHGSGTLSISEGNSTTAADLRLLTAATTVDINAVPTQVIDGSTTFSLTLSPTDSLQDLAQKINDAKVGVTASIFNDGSSVKPFRLILTSQVAGTAGQLRIDSSSLPFTLSESVKAQDALLLVNTSGTNGLLASSASNTFQDVLAGATLTVNGASATPVAISSTSSTQTLSAALTSVVDDFNKIHQKIEDLTAFDETSGTGALLIGDGSLLRVKNDLAELFTGRYFGLGKVQTLVELGLNMQSDGSLTFDQATFDAKFAEDSAAVEKFFTTATTGLAARMKSLTDQLAGPSSSVLASRNQSLTSTIDTNKERIERLSAHLATVQLRLLTSFYASESLIGKIKNNLNALSAINASFFANSSSSSS